MKTPFLLIALSSLLIWQAQGQSALNSTAIGQPATNPVPTETIVGYQTGVQDGNSQVLQKIVQETDAQGNVTYQTNNAYTELATGLNHLVNGQWVASSEEIDIAADGNSALATNGQHQAYFPGDIYNGEIELVTPDGKQLYSRPVGLSYFDGTNSVLIAELTNSTGEVVDTNQVIYTNAFTDFGADIRYTYTKAGFEQDIILRQQPPTPTSYGLNPDATRLQVLTEFFNPPQPTVAATTVPTDAGDLEDDELNFGMMQMGQGRAFLLGTNSPSATVNKQWLLLDGRQILVEEVPVSDIADELSQLPLPQTTSTQPISPLNVVSIKRLLPTQRLATVPSRHPMRIAKVAPASNGLVLDYVTLNSSTNTYTFRGDTTYYISGSFNISGTGTNTFEGGAVIKYATNTSIWLLNQTLWQASAYRPLIFTAVDDNSVGEVITNSTGNPTNYYAKPALTLTSVGNTMQYLRIAYAQYGIEPSDIPLVIRDSQFVNVANPIKATGSSVTLENILMYNVSGTALWLYGGGVTCVAQNLTVHNAATFLFLDGPSFGMTNSLVIATNLGSSFTGANNYSTNSDSGIFQTVGAGANYLATNCPAGIRGAGTTNIDPALLADLQTKTTYPPLLLTNQTISANTNLSPQAIRDTESPGPDLGYHYDPIDYIVDSYAITNATLTVTNGVAIASYNEPGIQLQSGSAIVSIGSPLYPNWFVRYTSVQEGTNLLGGTNIGSGITVNASDNGTAWPTGQFLFSKFACPAGCGYLFDDPGTNAYSSLLVQDCELWSGTNYFSGSTNTVTTLQNNLFDRSYFDAFNNSPAFLTLSNNLFFGETVTFYNEYATNTWRAFNNAFDSCSVTYNSYLGIGVLTNGYNAYLNCTNRLYPTNAFDIVTNASLAYQPGPFGTFYQPTNSPLINKGSTNANLLGLYHFTVTTNEVVEGTNIVSIGYHYVATDTNGIPLDSNGDGIPDYLEDPTGSGLPFTINLIAPLTTSVYTEPATIPIQATTFDWRSIVTNVEFIQGSIQITGLTNAPYNYTWPIVAAGAYTLTAIGQDNGGVMATSSVVNITVTNLCGY